MKIRAFVQQDIEAALDKEFKAGERAVTLAMRAAQQELKTNWRGQVTGAGLGQKLANTVRGESYPKGTDSMNAAALVWTRAPKLIGAYEKGGVIRSNSGFWLAIPTDAAGVGARGRKMTPLDWERRTGRRLRFVYRSGRSALLVADDVRLTKTRRVGRAKARKGAAGTPTVVIFTLVPQVRLKAKLNLMAAGDAVGSRLSQLILSNWPEV